MMRERLTITLRPDIIEQLDKVIDGEKIRNRSHAVEVLLSQALIPKSIKVLILAGGEGVNFRPFTYEMPKAMIPLGGKPLLEHTLESLRSCGITDITISVGHLGEKIKQHFGSGERLGLHISYLDQHGLVSGTAQPLAQAKSVFSGGTFLLMYGDVLADIDFIDLVEFHRTQRGSVGTMTLTSVERVSMWGLAKLAGNRIVEFEEKPHSPSTRSHLVNAGIYVLEPSIFEYIDPGAVRLESDVFPRLAEESKLTGYAFAGEWFDVSTPQVYGQVIKTIPKGLIGNATE